MPTIDFTTDPGPRTLERLQTEEVAWLSTISKDDSPVPTPVWFLWENDRIVIYSQPNTGKLRAIARSPHISFHFNSDADGNDIQVISGTAQIVQGPLAHQVPAYFEKYAKGFEHLKMSAEQMANEYNQRIELTPTKLRGW